MDRRNQLGTALVVLAAVLFVVPALFPVQPVLVHQTWDSATQPPGELRDAGYEIIAYENLSERGQELYVETLEHDGEYRVPLGQGAPEFDYPTAQERAEARENGDRSRLRGVVIERPEDATALPPADEPRVRVPERAEGQTSAEASERRQMIARYDAMDTSTEQPPLGSLPQLLRLVAVLLAVVSLGVGGYLFSLP